MRNQLNKMKLTSPVSTVLFLTCLLQPCTTRAVSLGQIDDFEDSILQGWQMGSANVTTSHMTNITDGGPTGPGDSFLQVVSHEVEPLGGNRLTFFNKAPQWTGDYLSTGITTIAFDVNNFSSSEVLNLRLAINGGFLDSNFNFIGGLFATSTSVSLDSGSGWTHVVFSLDPGDLTAVSGRSGTTGNDVMVTLAKVTELRLLNSINPDWSGLPVTATLGIDNISAVVVPLPPAVFLLGSGLLGICTLLQLRRRDSRR